MRVFKSLIFLLFILSSNSFASNNQFIENTNYYKNHFKVKSVLKKIVNNHGNGFKSLYGTRNIRTVLFGVYYRGGANNYFHKTKKRNNRNPLPTDGLNNLCQQGFTNAIYLYSTNFDKAKHKVSCKTMKEDKKNSLEYLNILYNKKDSSRKILNITYDIIQGKKNGPIYVHCWNGWHASGLMAALTLRQFCDFSGDQAVEYWNKGADGNTSSKHDWIRKKIRKFKPLSEFKISIDKKQQICPKMK